MSWSKVGSWRISDKITKLLPVFNSRLAIKVNNVANVKPTWYWAGYLYQYIDVPGIGNSLVGNRINVPIKDPLIFLPERIEPKFTLKFELPEWIDSLYLTIYKHSIELDMPFYPSQDSSGSSSFTNSSVNVVNTAIRLAVANVGRKNIAFANPSTSTANIYLGFDNTVTASSSYVIKPGQTYLLDFNWTGEIWAISNKTTATAVGIQEFV